MGAREREDDVRRGTARGDDGSIIRKTFARQARGFAASPVHNDPRRLQRLIEFSEPAVGSRALDVACGPGIVTAALQSTGLVAGGGGLSPGTRRLCSPPGGGYPPAGGGPRPCPA